MEKIIKTPVKTTSMGYAAYDGAEKQAICDLMEDPSKLFRYAGDYKTQSDLLEEEICKLTGIKHALVVNSGTSALICALAAYGIGPGDEVIIPGYTYIATATAVVNVGAVPVICEIDNSLSISIEDIKKKITKYTKAIMPVHMQGVPAYMDEVMAIAKENNLIVIEDACQAVGGTYKGKFHGSISDGAAWSLNYFKNITSGEGGVFMTNDSEAFVRAAYNSDAASPMWSSAMYTDKAIPPFTRSGYRVSEIVSTVGRVQLKKLPELLKATRKAKQLIIKNLNTPLNYDLQVIPDAEGDCSVSLGIIVKDKERAEKMANMLGEVGLNVGSCYNHGFPDRHIYKYWDSIMTKTGHTHLNYPWGDPSYKGNVEYSDDMCPNVLDILGRTLRVGISWSFNEANCIEIAQAINYVDGEI